MTDHEKLVFQRANPAELAKFDPATKRCTMNCGPSMADPRSADERQFLCDDCAAVVPWQPTAANINALPAPVRNYIHELVANCDPAGMVAQNIFLRDQCEGLQIMYRNVVDGRT